MEFILTKDYEAMSIAAAELIIEQIREKPDLTVCLPTGSTPRRMYELLIEANKEKRVDFSAVTVLSVDEYAGLSFDHVKSYAHVLHTTFLDKCNFDPGKIFLMNSGAGDLNAECGRYNRLIEESGGIDLYIDGIGENGHIAFNEPSEQFVLGVHIGAVSEWTARVNSRFFDSVDEVPKQVITLGVDDIINSKCVMILSNGPKKAGAIKRLVTENTITTQFPASFLKLSQNAVLIMDEETAGEVRDIIQGG